MTDKKIAETNQGYSMANPIKLKAVVTKVQSYGEGVYEVALKPVGTVPSYKPGQFLHLTVDEYDPAGGFWPESRVFSIASAYSTRRNCRALSTHRLISGSRPAGIQRSSSHRSAPLPGRNTRSSSTRVLPPTSWFLQP